MSEQQLKDKNIARPVPTVDHPYACDCCSKAIVTSKTIQLDHCHQKGLFRGWLCKECNISMGNLGDNIEGFIRAIKYLNRTEGKTIVEIKSMIDAIF